MHLFYIFAYFVDTVLCVHGEGEWRPYWINSVEYVQCEQTDSSDSMYTITLLRRLKRM